MLTLAGLCCGTDFIYDEFDSWQSYATLFKAQDSRADATQTLRHFGDKLEPRTVS